MTIYPDWQFYPKELFKGVTIWFREAKKVLPTKGNLVYEYNPLLNYRQKCDYYEHDQMGRIGIRYGDSGQVD
ncbi:MAG: hypothetical protein Nk1A_8580 [Endomicrobiia bacterium]|nr:MAG: hypothetical protein Nk1A_8580 [Endomicrobiia bacterium]